MVLTRAEQVIVRRAVEAYKEMRHKRSKGVFRGVTADQILEELEPEPTRWAELAAFVIACAEGDDERCFRSSLASELRGRGRPRS